MPAMRRGDHQAGTNQIKPSSKATKKRVPKANGKCPRECIDDSMRDGTSEPLNIASLRNLHGREHLFDDLIGRQPL